MPPLPLGEGWGEGFQTPKEKTGPRLEACFLFDRDIPRSNLLFRYLSIGAFRKTTARDLRLPDRIHHRVLGLALKPGWSGDVEVLLCLLFLVRTSDKCLSHTFTGSESVIVAPLPPITRSVTPDIRDARPSCPDTTTRLHVWRIGHHRSRCLNRNRHTLPPRVSHRMRVTLENEFVDGTVMNHDMFRYSRSLIPEHQFIRHTDDTRTRDTQDIPLDIGLLQFVDKRTQSRVNRLP